MQKKREAGDALKATARKQGNPAVSREYARAMDAIKKAKQALEGTTKTMTLETQKPKRDTTPIPTKSLALEDGRGV